MYRLSVHMEGPGRSRVRGLISKALQFRNATVPKMNVPLTIPFLAHDDFKRNVERWLRKTVVDFKSFAIPLFLPTRHLREAALPEDSRISTQTSESRNLVDTMGSCYNTLLLCTVADPQPLSG